MNRFFECDESNPWGLSGRRRGVVVVFTVVLLTVLCGFAAMTIDVGMMYGIKAELQRTADVAALAAVQDLRDADVTTVELARKSVHDYVERNPILNAKQALLDSERGVIFGRASVDEYAGKVAFAAGVAPPNAIQVNIAYEMDYIFASVFGLKSKLITARALAAVPPPLTADVVPTALPVPGFGPVDPNIAAHNPGKEGPSEPIDGKQFQPGEEVAIFFFGKGPRSPVHLVIDITESNGVAELNRLLATEESLGGEREPVNVSIGDEYYVWNEGMGNANFGVMLETRLEDSDPANDTVVMPIIETLPDTRDVDGRLVGKIRVVDFVGVTLTEVREVEVPDPVRPGSFMIISVMYGDVVELFSGSGGGFDTTSGTYTLGSVRTAPQLLQ